MHDFKNRNIAMMYLRSFLGEMIGTFVLVLLGCGSIAWSLFIAPLNLIEIAFIWGIGVILGIYISYPFSRSHLNPAVTLGFFFADGGKRIDASIYILAQLTGAFIAALSLYLIFQDHLLVKSIDNAVMFGEYYPNIGNNELAELPTFGAMCIEFFATFLLMVGILLVVKTNDQKPQLLNPVLIGTWVMILIYLFAPFTQCGMNPARDFAPRLFSYFAGWEMAFSYNQLGWLLVYVICPLFGAVSGAWVVKKVLLPRTVDVSVD